MPMRAGTLIAENLNLRGGGIDVEASFELGQVVATPGCLDVLKGAGQQPSEFLHRHGRGDWGDLDEEDRSLNDEALIDGGRILSAYTTRTGERIWIITEAVGEDGRRASSCCLLPEEH
ncbi:hypothetical protein TA3x_005593 [Tundrisphaera sp. TA3]|uniref:hypothetical protein n=1 Tax=Tundrisphaera sp. TA3 TaxID=3435775 RepID=UPI003EBC3064